MFYAHKGSSSDNAFTTFNGTPTRQFLAFETKAERQAAQGKIWEDSNGRENLIFCTRKFVESVYPAFYVAADGTVWQSADLHDAQQIGNWE